MVHEANKPVFLACFEFFWYSGEDRLANLYFPMLHVLGIEIAKDYVLISFFSLFLMQLFIKLSSVAVLFIRDKGIDLDQSYVYRCSSRSIIIFSE